MTEESPRTHDWIGHGIATEHIEFALVNNSQQVKITVKSGIKSIEMRVTREALRDMADAMDDALDWLDKHEYHGGPRSQNSTEDTDSPTPKEA